MRTIRLTSSIHVMDVDGSNLKTLTTDVVSTWAPSVPFV